MARDEWHQIEIEDDAALAGSSLAHLVSRITSLLPVKFVVVGRAEGAGSDFAQVFKNDLFTEFSLDEFSRVVHRVTQFDWGDFYLVEQEKQLTGLDPMSPYAEILPRTLATVRAVDDTYFYIYVRDERAASALFEAYPSAVRKHATLQELDFPD